METTDDMHKVWGGAVDSFNPETVLKREQLILLIKKRIKKEKNIVAQYAIASWVWQFIVYVFVVRALISFWGDPVAVGVCLAGMLLYAQFTFRYARFCAAMLKSAGARQTAVDSIGNNLIRQRDNLAAFFRFKKRFDLIGIPVVAGMIIIWFEELQWIPSVAKNPVPAMMLFVFVTGICSTAAYLENKKRFMVPLENLSHIQQEITRLE